MRAVCVGAPGRAELAEVRVPEARDDELVVEVEWASVCATDRKLMARGSPEPRVIGHEAGARLRDGTLVGVHPDVGCGRCRLCRAGFENRCADRVSIGIDRDGCLAEHVAVPRSHILALDGVDAEVAPLLEPLACVLHAVSQLGPEKGQTAVVVGAGAMGILSTWVLQAHGCTVALSQRSAERRGLAAALGADAVVAPGEDLVDALGGEPDIALVAAPGPEALAWACDRVVAGGRVHVFAGSPGGAPLDANVVHYRHLNLLGSTGSTVADYARARDLVASGEMKLQRLPYRKVALEDVVGVLARDQEARCLKVIVDVRGGCV